MEKEHFETKDILPRSEEFVSFPEDTEGESPEWVGEMLRKAFQNKKDEEDEDEEDLDEDVGDDEQDRL